MAETNYKIELNVLNQYHKGITCDDDAVKRVFYSLIHFFDTSHRWK